MSGQHDEAPGAAETAPGFLACSFCMFDQRRPEDPDSQADLEVVMVINGHSTCLWHAGYAQGAPWSLKLAALKEQR